MKPSRISTAQDLQNILEPLQEEQQLEVYTSVVYRISNLIENVFDFSNVLQFLPPKPRTDVYIREKNSLPARINSPRNFISVVTFLEPKQRTEIYNLVKTKLLSFDFESDELMGILHFLLPIQIFEICTAVHKRKFYFEDSQGFLKNALIKFYLMNLIPKERVTHKNIGLFKALLNGDPRIAKVHFFQKYMDGFEREYSQNWKSDFTLFRFFRTNILQEIRLKRNDADKLIHIFNKSYTGILPSLTASTISVLQTKFR